MHFMYNYHYNFKENTHWKLYKKWKNLKDTFIRVKGDIEEYVASGSERKKRRKVWKHYENMKFLNDKQNKKK